MSKATDDQYIQVVWLTQTLKITTLCGEIDHKISLLTKNHQETLLYGQQMGDQS